MYSIIDIETTGARSRENKITEIAIINFDGQKVTETFSTLINPETSIPPFIQKLTGITNEMVVDAPKFYEVAKKIVELTEGNIFVAHNVHFDFNFIQQEFRELGFQFKKDKLCTVRLARKVLPGHSSYSLGNICRDLGIANQARHRAMGDAQATLELFKIILAANTNAVHTMTKETNATLSFPPYLNPDDYASLPNTAGVYYLWDKEMKLLYIGKSKDIKKRVAQHFKVTTQRTKEMVFKNNIAHITYKETGSDLAAQLIECQEIKNHRPIFNRSMNKKRYPFGVYLKKDKTGRLEFSVTNSHMDEAIQVGSRHTAKSLIARLYRQAFAIAEDVMFENQMTLLQKVLPLGEYNLALQREFHKLHYPEANFEIIVKGRTQQERCYIQVMDYKLSKIIFKSDEEEEVFPIEENRDSRRILLSNLQKRSVKIYPLN